MPCGKANTPEAANNLRKVLRHLLDHGVALRMITANPVIGTKRFKTSGEGIHTWTEAEVEQFAARHPLGSQAYLAMALCTGQRLGDVVRMGWQHVRGNKIAVRQEKTNAPLLIPIASMLAQALESVPPARSKQDKRHGNPVWVPAFAGTSGALFCST
jgi:integrase